MIAVSNKVPPQLSNSKSYSDWVHLVEIWTKFTDLGPERQVTSLVISLSEKALESILELDDKDTSGQDGVKLFLKNWTSYTRRMSYITSFKTLTTSNPIEEPLKQTSSNSLWSLTNITTSWNGTKLQFRRT